MGSLSAWSRRRKGPDARRVRAHTEFILRCRQILDPRLEPYGFRSTQTGTPLPSSRFTVLYDVVTAELRSFLPPVEGYYDDEFSLWFEFDEATSSSEMYLEGTELTVRHPVALHEAWQDDLETYLLYFCDALDERFKAWRRSDSTPA